MGPKMFWLHWNVGFQAAETWDFFDKLKILAVQEEVKKAFTFYEKGM